MNYKNYLEKELKTAFGCIEPTAIVYTVAKAKEVLDHEPDRVQADLSVNIIKNAHSAYVPGARGREGIDIFLMAGAPLGQSAHELEVLAHTDKIRLEDRNYFIQQSRIQVRLKENATNLYIQVTAHYRDSHVRVLVVDEHANIVWIEKDGEIFYQKSQPIQEEIQMDLSSDKIYGYVQTADLKDFQDLLGRGTSYGYAIAQEGIQNPWRSGTGRLTLERHPQDLREKVVAYTATGPDARMSGAENPVVINSGSGNQGISVPALLTAYTKEKNLDRGDLQRDLLFANLLSLYQKRNIDKLSVYCGVVSITSSAICGLAFLKREGRQVTRKTLASALAVNGGILCDGAKASYAMKTASSLRNALLAYDQARTDQSLKAQDGTVKDGIDQTLKAVGDAARYGTKKTDEMILDEVLENRDYLRRFE